MYNAIKPKRRCTVSKGNTTGASGARSRTGSPVHGSKKGGCRSFSREVIFNLFRCRLEALPALHNLLEALPYFDYGLMAFALPLFLMQRAPFKIMENRMVTLYKLIEEFDMKENEESIEEHRAVLIKKSCAKKYCRVGDIYLYSYLMKYPVAILTIIFIHLNWGPSGKLGAAEEELSGDPPCRIGENYYKCNIANMKEIQWFDYNVDSDEL